VTRKIDRAFESFVKRGEAEALSRVFDATAGELLRVGSHLVKDLASAEDLVQMTFLAAIEDRASHLPGRPVLPWLLGIMANRARNLRRVERRRPDPQRVQAGPPLEPPEEAQASELSAAVEDAVANLPDPYRPVLNLHLRHGLSAAEIARSLERPQATVRSQLARGMDRLRRALPAGFAAGFAMLPSTRGLAAIRVEVLDKAQGVPTAQAEVLTVAGSKLGLGLMTLGLLLVAGFFVWQAEDRERPLDSDSASLAEAERGASSTAAREEPPPMVARVEAPSPDAEPALATLLVQAVLTDGSPAAGAPALLISTNGEMGVDERSFRFDAAGELRVDGLEPGHYFVHGLQGGTVDLELGPGEDGQASLEIPEGVSLSGLVVDAEGRPLADASVLLCYSIVALERREEVARSDSQGRFRVEHLQPGRALSAVGATGLPASIYWVRKGQTEEEPIRLQVGGSEASLQGVVRSFDGTPIAGARIQVGASTLSMDGSSSRPPATAISEHDGSFSLASVQFGEAIPIWVRAVGTAPWHRVMDLAANESPQIQVELGPGATLRGRVDDGLGRPLNRALISITSPRIHPVSQRSPRWAGGDAWTDAGGRFEIRHLVPGEAGLLARHSEHRALEQKMSFQHGSQREWYPVLSKGLMIRGLLLDAKGEALPERFVRIYDPSDLYSHRLTKSNAEGRFLFDTCDDVVYQLSVGLREDELSIVLPEISPGPELHRVVLR
jgi:RNA polymerase sigma-70 factor (ECF subfamily)